MKGIFLALAIFSGLLLSQKIFGQTPGQISDESSYSADRDSISSYNPMDPNEDGYSSVNTGGYSAGVEDNEIDWIAIPQLSLEPNEGNCGATETVDNPDGGGQASYVFFDNSQDGVEYLVYRIRLATDPTGGFGYSILVDTDGKIGPADPNAIVNNPGFEYEVRVSLANNDGGTVYIEDIDGTTTGTEVASYSQADHFQKVYARFQDPACTTENVQFFDFFIDIADMGLTSSSAVRLAAATAPNPNSSVLSNPVDIAGIDDALIGSVDSLANQDSVFIQLIKLQHPTPISSLGEGGCFKTGTSNTPVVYEPVFDSNTRINGYVDEPEGAFVTVFRNGDTLATGLVTSTGRWSVTFNQGDIRPYDEITAIAADSCELSSDESTQINVIKDADSDDDGILDATDEGNGVDPGGDVDGDGIPNYKDTDYSGFTDTEPADGIDDNFDQDGDGLPNHLDPDANGDGIYDFIAAGGDPADDANSNGIIDAMEDDDGDGIPNSVDADHQDNAGCTDEKGTEGSYPDGICDIYQDTNNDGDLSDETDTDGDGIADMHDPDADGDGLAAEVDTDEGGTQLEIDDLDEDGLPNHLDKDSDGDGIPDSAESTTNDEDGDGFKDFLDIDADGDGIPDYIEAQASNTPVTLSGADTDGDGVDNSFDPDNGGVDLSSPADKDSDGTPDYLDADADNDGVNDLIESNDINSDGVADTSPSGLDTDNDGLDDTFDADNNGSLPPLQDTDGDGVPDFRDSDDDADGVATLTEGTGFSQGGGTIPDYLYNADSDGDGVQNINDLDSENDGIPDEDEDGGTGYNPTGDEDGDGTLNYLDLDEAAYAFETDTNGDGIVDAFDFDSDGLPDFLDLDSDNDGITDIIEAGGTDTNEDGLVDDFTDDDNDGLHDVYDNVDSGSGTGEITSGTPLNLADTDADGLHDFYDIDADNDGIPDNVEAQSSGSYISPTGNDADNDGLDNAYDTHHATGVYLSPVNTDATGDPDYQDTDADGDGVNDNIEGHDANKDGFGDWDSSGNGVVNGNEGTGDADSDGLLDAFDSNNTTFDPTASNAVLQDTDGDGTKDFQDTDDDGDGTDTATEGTGFTQGGGSIPDYMYNPDSDGDGINDGTDLDADNDGILDIDENGGVIDEQGAGSGESLSPTGDRNGGGILNYLDLGDNNFTATDSNGDGIVDEFDSDLDGIPDFKDLDSDNDGVLDIVEAGGVDTDNDGRVDNPADTDGDGYSNTFDADNGGTPLANSDTDGDGIANPYDLDSDNDGIPDILENGGTDADGDGRTDDTSDTNVNGIADEFEGFPLPMLDSDGDSIPNNLDLDSDGDGISDVMEAGGTDSGNDGLLDAFADADGDGLNDLVDSDNGGTALSVAESDNDGLANFLDTDSDADGIPDNNEAQTTADYRAASGTDSDGDGIDDSYDVNNSGAITPVNTDGKDVADYLDSDSDNDGISDAVEGNDADGDGTKDAVPTGSDTDNDGLDNAFDTDNGGTAVAIQDLDADGTPDWRDTDDDGDGIATIDEPLDLNPSNGIKDYLENSLGYCGIQSIATDFAGNADAVETNSGVTSPTNSLQGGDNADATFDDTGDFVILDLTDIVPYDSAITVRYRSSKNNTATVRLTASANPSSGFGNSVDLSDNNNDYNNTQYTVGATSGIRYLRFEMTGSSGGAHFLLDAVSYQFTQCDPDWDNDAVKDTDDNDDDNDGIPDETELTAGLLGDEDTDGVLNFEDTGYSGFVDTNSDGIDDNADFDSDGIPNHKDLDSDNDGITDAVEANEGALPANMLDDGRFSVAYVLANDNNDDGLANIYDPSDGGASLATPNTDGADGADFLDLDADDDGKDDYIEGFDDDTSTDALNDYLSRAENFEAAAGSPGFYTATDSDLNGIPNWLEIGANGVPQFLDNTYGSYHDTDNDGVVDLFDHTNFGTAYAAPDADEDGMPDYRDADDVTTLPLNFLTFEGKVTDGQIVLEWTTTNEVNVSHFEVLHSITGQTFKAVGKVNAVNLKENINTYSVTHTSPSTGYNFYKIREVDYDGYEDYTDVINVMFDGGSISWNIYPNPVSESLRVRSNAIIPKVEVMIMDISGRNIFNKQVSPESDELEIDLSGLKNGIYHLIIRLPDSTQSFRIIKK